jgi:hypothetical protein
MLIIFSRMNGSGLQTKSYTNYLGCLHTPSNGIYCEIYKKNISYVLRVVISFTA